MHILGRLLCSPPGVEALGAWPETSHQHFFASVSYNMARKIHSDSLPRRWHKRFRELNFLKNKEAGPIRSFSLFLSGQMMHDARR